MEELIHKIMSGSGISREQAAISVEETLRELKKTLPASVGGQLEAALEGKKFNYKPVLDERLNEVRNDASGRFREFSEEMKERLDELSDSAEDELQSARKSMETMFRKLFI